MKDEGDVWVVFSREGKLYRRALNIVLWGFSSGNLERAKKRLELARKALLTDFSMETLPLRKKLADIALRDLNFAETHYSAEVLGVERDIRLSKMKQLFIAV